MPRCFFVSDLHGSEHRYRTLAAEIARDRPNAVFIGGDLLPGGFDPGAAGLDLLLEQPLREVHAQLGEAYPEVFLILGNDDPRAEEAGLERGTAEGLWRYMHGVCAELSGHPVFGYAHVPPTPFLLKDWERYDVSRFVDPGCVSPEQGWRTHEVEPRVTRCATIAGDLAKLTGDQELSGAVLLFHTPPYRTNLDRAALDGKMIDHVPLDVNIGSIAVRRLIEERQPLLTLHGHVHESARLTGGWRDRIGRTHLFSAAHDGPSGWL